MNKAEFAVCRIKEKLPGNQGFLTKGSGCVVHCETLTTSWGWKCHHFIVTPSVVLCREDLSSDKTFVVEFLSKDKRGLETFEVKQMAEFSKDLVGRGLDGDFVRDDNLTFLSVEPLDKRGFLKKMVKKGSLQTFRPLDCLDSQSKFQEESLINEGLFCHVISNLFSESTNLPFSTQTFKLVYESQTRQFSLQDFGGSAVRFSQVKPPVGAVIFTKKGEFAGVVNFVDDCTVSPVFLPEPSMTESGQEDRPGSCDGVNTSMVAMASDEEYLAEHNQEENMHPETDIHCDENSHVVKCLIDDVSHYNNNASLSSEGFLPHEEVTNSAKSEPCVIDEGSGIDIFQQDQGCADGIISGAACETENVLDSVNGTTNLKANFEESPEEDKSNFPVIEEEAPDKEAERSIIPSLKTEEPYFAAKATNVISSDEEIEQAALSSLSGSNISRDDDSLVTVIQVGEMKPEEMETTGEVDTSNEKIAEQDHLVCSGGEVVSSENESSNPAKEQADIKEAAIECLPDNKDGQTTLSSKDDSVSNEENLATDDFNLCITENDTVALVGSMPEIQNNSTDSIQKPNAQVDTETSVENLQGDDATLVIQSDEDVTDFSEGTANSLLENSKVSIYVTPANGDDVNHTKDGDNLKESQSHREDVSEDWYQQNSSAEVSLATEPTDEMAGNEIRDPQSNVDTDTSLSGIESAQESGVDVSLNLEQVDAKENTEVMYKDLDEHIEAELGQHSPRFDGDQAVITHTEFSNLAGEAFVSTQICEHSDHNQNDLDTAETPDVTGEEQADKYPIEDSLSCNVAALEKEVDGQNARTIVESDADETEGLNDKVCVNSIEDAPSSNVVALEERRDGQDVRTVLETACDVKLADAVDKEECGVSSLDDALVLQRVDADSLLTETITNNPPILRDLGECLDTEYQHGQVPCWRDLAELLDIPPEAYEHCGTFSATSPTEDLFVFLAATKSQLTIQEIQEALREIDRHEVAQLLDRKIAGGMISKESVVSSLVERDDTDILGRMALKLDRKQKNDWKGLALQLSVPQRVLRNFGSHQRHNSSLMLLKYIPIFDPELTLEHLKGCLVSIGRQDAVEILENAGIPGDEPVKDILDDSDLLDQITDLLNEDPPAAHWRHLANELKIPQEKCKIFEPTEENNNSPTKLLFKSIGNWEPDLTFEELVLALVAMKRHDVLNVLQKYFSSDDVEQILEENNLLAPMEDHPDENES